MAVPGLWQPFGSRWPKFRARLCVSLPAFLLCDSRMILEAFAPRIVAAIVFALAVLHTFSTKWFARLVMSSPGMPACGICSPRSRWFSGSGPLSWLSPWLH